MLRLGILGVGCIGYRVAQAVADGTLPYQLSAYCELREDNCARLEALLPVYRAEGLDELARRCDVLLESAAAHAVPELLAAMRHEAQRGRSAGRVLIMSVGGLLHVAAEIAGPVIHVPSGAIGGLDAVQALAVAGLDEVTLTTRKPPAGLGMDVRHETVVFEGSARDVVAKYPKNVNVAMALSFAGVGPDRTMCRLIADPAVDRNTHHVSARGPAGEVEFTSRNVAFPDNPATSYLAALSAIALLKKLASGMQVG